MHSKILLILALGAWAQNSSPLTPPSQPAPSQLKTLQVKLTYLGPQKEPMPTIGFSQGPYKVDRFKPFYRKEYEYGNDAFALKTFRATKEELKNLVNLVTHVQEKSKLAPSVLHGKVSGSRLLSFSWVYRSGDQDKFFEAIWNSSEAQEFFVLMRDIFEKNKEARATFQWWGCALDLLTPVVGKDVTSHVQITLGGFYPKGDHFLTRATLKNISTGKIPEPLSLVVIPTEPNVRLINPDGTTCKIYPVGNGFINISLPSPDLSPGESVETVLEFENPDRDPIRFDTKVIAGPIER
ncbi:MAG: hypothetical protein HY399_08205 [Elusimicrobia bacterium]|nr:hypothetical protein [Elusimicrobiota bacterium]